jgi:hypothetical protein
MGNFMIKLILYAFDFCEFLLVIQNDALAMLLQIVGGGFNEIDI